jgi:ABC-type branched-subunit amino acid transport system ATPase component
MKQKLALACALVAEPRVLLLDEPTTGVDPVSRREFWDTLVDLSSQGMTILVATPYLDEAERCHRVALMHQGLLVRTGTPAGIRQGLGLARLDVRASDLRAAEVALSGRHGITDVQRFGDRLDVLVRDAADGERAVRAALAEVGQSVGSMRTGAPTLENAFVSILQALEGEARAPEFPGHRREPRHPDAIAIGARGLGKSFGAFTAVKGIDLEVRPGEVYGLLGANGAGKTTTLRAITGLLEVHEGDVTKGEISFDGAEITDEDPAERVRRGISQVMEGRRIFAEMTVDDNLRAGGYVNRDKARVTESRDRVMSLFPRLAERSNAVAGYLSGGEQQMLSIGRALMQDPKLLILDEPSLGLAPRLVQEVRDIIVEINKQGTSVLLIEQNAKMALSIAHHGYIMETGKLVMDGDPARLLKDEDVKEFYLGLGATGEQKSFRDVKHYKRRKRWLS